MYNILRLVIFRFLSWMDYPYKLVAHLSKMCFTSSEFDSVVVP